MSTMEFRCPLSVKEVKSSLWNKSVCYWLNFLRRTGWYEPSQAIYIHWGRSEGILFLMKSISWCAANMTQKLSDDYSLISAVQVTWSRCFPSLLQKWVTPGFTPINSPSCDELPQDVPPNHSQFIRAGLSLSTGQRIKKAKKNISEFNTRTADGTFLSHHLFQMFAILMVVVQCSWESLTFAYFSRPF